MEALFVAIILNNGQVLIIPRVPNVLQTLHITITALIINTIIRPNIINNLAMVIITISLNTPAIVILCCPMVLSHLMEDYRRAYHSHSQHPLQWWMKFTIQAVRTHRMPSIMQREVTQGNIEAHCRKQIFIILFPTDVICPWITAIIIIAITTTYPQCHMQMVEWIHGVEVFRKA